MAGNSSFDQDKHRLADYDTDSGSGSFSSTSRCYNAKTGELLGRSLVSWSKLLSFFALFSAIVAAFWGLFWVIFYQTLDPYRPKVLGDLAIINGSSPGLGYRPQGGLGFIDKDGVVQGASIYSSLIWFRHGGNGNYENLTANLDTFLEQYEAGAHPNQGASITKCDFNSPPKEENQMCEFNREWLSDPTSDIKCIAEEQYGYYFGKPCMLLKMNRVFGWVPEPYTIQEVRNHTTMPRRLKADIEAVWEDKCGSKGMDEYSTCPELNMVWLYCDGENDPDKENIGMVSYHPFHGFPGYFFPYRNQLGFLSPLVMVQLKNPTPAILMNLQCTAWAKNIDQSSSTGAGHVHFELLMD